VVSIRVAEPVKDPEKLVQVRVSVLLLKVIPVSTLRTFDVPPVPAFTNVGYHVDAVAVVVSIVELREARPEKLVHAKVSVLLLKVIAVSTLRTFDVPPVPAFTNVGYQVDAVAVVVSIVELREDKPLKLVHAKVSVLLLNVIPVSTLRTFDVPPVPAFTKVGYHVDAVAVVVSIVELREDKPLKFVVDKVAVDSSYEIPAST